MSQDESIQLVNQDETKYDNSDGKTEPQAHDDSLPKWLQGTKDSLQEAKQESTPRFIAKMFGVACGLGASMVFLLPLSFVAIAMIVIGALYKEQCPGQHLIPIWMIVFGSTALLQMLLNIFRMIVSCSCSQNGENGSKEKAGNYCGRSGYCLESIATVFMFIWVIIGSVWVFGYYNTYRSPACVTSITNTCCAPLPYMFSFVILIIMYAVSILALLVTCCCCCCCLICCGVLTAASSNTEK